MAEAHTTKPRALTRHSLATARLTRVSPGVARLTQEMMAMYVNLRPYVNEAALVTTQNTSLRRTADLFRSMGLRHLLVIESCPRVVGMITRKDIICTSRHSNRALHSLPSSPLPLRTPALPDGIPSEPQPFRTTSLREPLPIDAASALEDLSSSTVSALQKFSPHPPSPFSDGGQDALMTRIGSTLTASDSYPDSLFQSLRPSRLARLARTIRRRSVGMGRSSAPVSRNLSRNSSTGDLTGVRDLRYVTGDRLSRRRLRHRSYHRSYLR